MKYSRLLLLLIFSLSLCSCSCYLTTMPIEMQGQSASRSNLWQKSVLVAYDKSGTEELTEFHRNFAIGFAKGIQNCCSGDNADVEIIELPLSDTLCLYNTKAGMLDLLMEYDKDVVIHIPNYQQRSTDIIQYILVYDSKDARDKVLLNKYISTSPSLYTNTNDRNQYARYFGYQSSGSYSPTWTYAEFPIYSGPSGTPFGDAFEKAEIFLWPEAIAIWMPLTKAGNPTDVRAKAAFNLAIGCFFEKKYELAEEWLKLSDLLEKSPQSDQLHNLFETYTPR